MWSSEVIALCACSEGRSGRGAVLWSGGPSAAPRDQGSRGVRSAEEAAVKRYAGGVSPVVGDGDGRDPQGPPGTGPGAARFSEGCHVHHAGACTWLQGAVSIPAVAEALGATL